MYLTENKIVYLPNIKEEKMDYEKIVRDLDLQSENIYGNISLNEGRKRMRLHQLSWEEKIQRKKLRNRIAAQTSRDRKKAKMDHLEESVKELKRENELLLIQVEQLKKKNEMLVDANAELQKALAERPYTCSCLKKVKEEEEGRKIVELSNDVEEQICVEDGYSFERPAESSEIPQQKGRLPTSAQGDTFLDDLERLASSLLEEVEQHESRRNPEPVLKEISGTGKQKCTFITEMVGEASEKLEPSGSEINTKLKGQQNCFQYAVQTTKEKIWFISSEHSYASPSLSEVLKTKSNGFDLNLPIITISESDKISAIESELKKDIEPDILNSNDNLNIPMFPHFHSPRSEASDQGYESAGSQYDNEALKMEAFDDFNELWGDAFSELFPELM